jgi:hypothetical protein
MRGNKPAVDAGDFGAIEPHNVPLQIKHPKTGKYLGLTINLRWFGSDPVKSVQRSITDRRLKLSQRRKDFNAEQLENANFDQLIAAIEGWTWEKNADGNDANIGGERPDFNAVNARNLFQRFPWIATQCDEKLAADEDFF